MCVWECVVCGSMWCVGGCGAWEYVACGSVWCVGGCGFLQLCVCVCMPLLKLSVYFSLDVLF